MEASPGIVAIAEITDYVFEVDNDMSQEYKNEETGDYYTLYPPGSVIERLSLETGDCLLAVYRLSSGWGETILADTAADKLETFISWCDKFCTENGGEYELYLLGTYS